jgi:leader peptidase (prepilin peptidase)/N-methyltransferase
MIYILLTIIGLALGSFVNALVWRLREQEDVSGKKPSKKRNQYLKDLSIMKGRSMCTHCHHQLVARDLIPVLSWLSLGGKCRYCGKPIGWQYPFVEMLTAIAFIVSYIYWPSGFHGLGLLEFICWLLLMTGFMALAVYDLRWFLLPNRIIYPLLVLTVVELVASILFFHGGTRSLLGSIWGVLIGGGIFYILFQASGGKMIGGGDVKLGALLGLLIGGPIDACLLLFVASLCGTIIALPLMAAGKAKRTTLVPFGPFLLLAAFLIELFGTSLVMWLRQRGYLPPA